MSPLPWLRAGVFGLVLLANDPRASTLPNTGDRTDPIHHHETNRQAFALPMAELSDRELRAFTLGNRNFNLRWVSAPASAIDVDGLGPTFVQASCSACHLRDGRGAVPRRDGERIEQAVVKLSPARPEFATWLAAHVGDQLQSKAIPGVRAEADPRVRWRLHRQLTIDDRELALRSPGVELHAPRARKLPARVLTQVLVAPSVFGLGLIEAIERDQILAMADPDDRDGDGISGRASFVDVDGRQELGRFGWKATVPSLRAQTQLAAIGDMGLTSQVHAQENCPPRQRDCRKAKTGNTPDLSERFTDAIETYLRLLAVPAPRTAQSPAAMRGRDVFAQIGCARCHRPGFVTGAAAAHPVLNQRAISPYSDFLLHDMGAELADGRARDQADSREWRTPPLWGLGLQQTVNGHLQLLHDGRADGVVEAILWHGGEAEAARRQFESLPREQRRDLLAFLDSL